MYKFIELDKVFKGMENIKLNVYIVIERVGRRIVMNSVNLVSLKLRRAFHDMSTQIYSDNIKLISHIGVKETA